MIWRDDDISCKTKLINFSEVHEILKPVKHTIAIIAKDIHKNTELVNYINEREIEFDVQLHCYDHYILTENHKRLNWDLEEAIRITKDVFGSYPSVLYPPWNLTDDTVNKIAAQNGLVVNAEKISLEQYIRKQPNEGIINFHHWCKEEIPLLKEAIQIYVNSTVNG